MGEERSQSSASSRSKDHSRQRVYNRPKVLEKDKSGKTLQPLAARVQLGKGTSIRGVASGSKSATPPLRGARRGDDPETWVKEKGRGSSAAALASTKKSNIVLLKAFVIGRYDTQRKFLNLERLADDPFWKANDIAPLDGLDASKDLGAVILKLAGQLEPPVETLSLAHNNFRNLRQLAHMNHYLPNLANLSLQDNHVGSSKELTYLTGKHGAPSKLQEIILLDNPFQKQAEKNGNLPGYRHDIARTFPRLDMLDMTPVLKISFDATPEIKVDRRKPDLDAVQEFTVPMAPAVLPENVKDLATAFLATFFTKFDNDRPSLADAYAPSATFSYSINTTVSPRARLKRYYQDMPHQKKLDWADWQANSRNLDRVRHVKRSATLLQTSTVEILRSLEKHVPATKHEITGEGAANFLVDAWAVDGVLSADTSPPIGTALFVTVHGQFTEVETKGIRSFDRTFILAPSAERSKARLAGWQLVVVSDLLVVRNYSSPESWAPGPLRVQVPEPEGPHPEYIKSAATLAKLQPNKQLQHPLPAAPHLPQSQPQPAPPMPHAVQPVLNSEMLAKLPEAQRELTIQLQMQTGLNTQFAGECMDANGWNLAQAVENFNRLRPTIPLEAFQ